MNTRDRVASRRQFLLFLAASPLLSSAARVVAQQAASAPAILSSANDALGVADFEEAARRALPPAH